MKREPILYTIKFMASMLLIICAVLLIGFTFSKYLRGEKSDTSLPIFKASDESVIVIDAGHGGEDAGAVSPDGTLEKDLNLEISRLLYALCKLNGNEAKLTRDSDTLLYDYYKDLDNYTGKKKVYDLKNRVKITEEEDNPIYVGIHMNKFQESKYSGLQVYYSKNNDLSKSLASLVQNNTREYLQADNKRKIKQADSSIHILDSLECPAVLIECGFLSNEQEVASLKDSNYKASLSLVIFSSILESKME